MNRYTIKAYLESPLAIRQGRQSQRSPSLTSVSGTTLRGALAALYLQHRGAADQTFRNLFLDESRCRFGPLDPAPHVLPLTAASCKRSPGFIRDDKHGAIDLLWMRIGLRLGRRSLPLEDLKPWLDCQAPNCKGALQDWGGYWADGTEGPTAVMLRRSVDVHVGIDRRTATAARSILYSMEVLEPAESSVDGARRADLIGQLEAEADVYQQLQVLLQQEDDTIDLGHARTRGYGRTRLELAATPAPNDDEGGRESWGAWNAELCRFLQEKPFAVGDVDPAKDLFFALLFPTGAILVDDLLRYTLDPQAAVSWLPPLGGHRQPPDFRACEFGGRIQCVLAVVRHQLIRGWNSAHGLPRQDEWSLARGSVAVYRFQGTEAERAELLHRLATLRQEGLGLRRGEGFGRIEVCPEFSKKFCRQESRP